MRDVKLLIISHIGIKALGKLCLASIYWNHLVAEDRIWGPMAARLGCPLREGIPFYRQVVLIMQNVRDKLVFIDRCAYLGHEPVSFSPLSVLTQADLDNENEEKKPPDPDQGQKRAHLENALSDEEREEETSLRGLTVNQTLYLQNLKRARDMLEAWDFIHYDDTNDWEDIPPLNRDEIVDVQTIFAKAQEFSNWYKINCNETYFDHNLDAMFVEPFTEEMNDFEEFLTEMLNDRAKRNSYLVEQYLERAEEKPSPPWIKEYADVQTLSCDNVVTFSNELATFRQLQNVYLRVGDNVIEVLEELDKLPNLEVLKLCLDSGKFPVSQENTISSRLRELTLYHIKEEPKGIGKFTLLQKLALWCDLEHLPKELITLTQLEELVIGHNLTEIPGTIGRFSSLKKLDVSRNQISALPVQICRLFPNLEMLDLSDNQFNEEFYLSFSEQIREVIRNGKLEGENLALFKEEARSNFKKLISLSKNFIIKQ